MQAGASTDRDLENTRCEGIREVDGEVADYHCEIVVIVCGRRREGFLDRVESLGVKDVLVLDAHLHDLGMLEDFNHFDGDEITHVFHGLAHSRNGYLDAICVSGSGFGDDETRYIDREVFSVVVLAPDF
jgi:hypothetical protein